MFKMKNNKNGFKNYNDKVANQKIFNLLKPLIMIILKLIQKIKLVLKKYKMRNRIFKIKTKIKRQKILQKDLKGILYKKRI